MRTRRLAGNSLLASLAFHALMLLLLLVLWKPPLNDETTDWIEADLLNATVTDRPALRRNRPLEVREGPNLDDSTVSPATRVIERPSTRLMTATRVRRAEREQPSIFPLPYEERLTAPEADYTERHQTNNDNSQPRSRNLLSGRAGKEQALSLGARTRPRRDAVGDAMMAIAEALTGGEGEELDVLFLLDSSGSMEPHIQAVADHLNEMAEAIQEAQVDVRFGMLAFKRLERRNIVQTWGLTQDLPTLRKAMHSLVGEGDEHALDVLWQTLSDFPMRERSAKGWVLVTNERLTGDTELGAVVQRLQRTHVRVSVLGLEDPEHQSLAKETQGLWFPLPTSY